MYTKNDFYSTSSSFKLNKEIIEFDASNNFIAVAVDLDVIDIYSLHTFTMLLSFNIYLGILHIKFHPKYSNVFSVTLQNSSVHIYYINTKENKIEDKCEYLCSKENSLLKTIFSPYDDGKTLATISFSDIKIWRMDNYYFINNIKTHLNYNRIVNFQFKWSESGEYLVFPKNNSKIEVYSLSSRSIEYFFDSYANDFYFIEEKKQMIIVTNIFIYLWDLENNKQIFRFKHDNIIKTNYDNFSSFLYLLDNEKIVIYDFLKKEKIYDKTINYSYNFFLLKNTDNNSSLLLKLLLYHSQIKQFEVLSIFTKNNNQQNPFKIEEASEDFWNNSINKIYNDYEHLSHIYNKKEDNEIIKKKYLLIDTIEKELKDLLKNNTLKEKREIVVQEMKKFNENENIYNAYLNYIKNIIKDNTNQTLLIKYLIFLKNNNTKLSDKFQSEFENFDNEINQFQVCFSKTILRNKLNYLKMKSEHEKLLDFLNEFSLLDLEKMGEKELNNFINDKKIEIENFRFNQPISFDNNNELYFCRNRIILLYNINQIIDRKKYDILKDMKYCIQQVLNRNFLRNEQIIKNNIYLTFIIILIAVPQRKILTDYNLNLIDNKDIDVTDIELKKLGFKYNKYDNTFEYNNIIIQNDKEKMKLYNLKNLNLFINNQNEDIFELHELYKFDEFIIIKMFLKKFFCFFIEMI